MIPARKSALFSRWFAGVARRRLTGAFGRLSVRGLDDVARTCREQPLLVVSNHTAWWDPLVVLHLTTNVWRVDAYALMDAKNLRDRPFFGRVGAFGVDMDDPADGARAIRYAAKLLDRPGRLAWVFAQGREVPVTARALGFRGGGAQVARVAAQAAVIPAALRYEHGGRPEPDIYVSFGEVLERTRDVARATKLQERAVATELERIDDALVSGDASDFVPLFDRLPRWWSTVAERGLARLTRPGS